ncbi:hypothetical protein KCP70_13890 [Salmonella enterica subsp. enterica]|nr:hypothetical protein KCP70_13890 [Salmonella enterica subsp. enterica]
MVTRWSAGGDSRKAGLAALTSTADGGDSGVHLLHHGNMSMHADWRACWRHCLACAVWGYWSACWRFLVSFLFACPLYGDRADVSADSARNAAQHSCHRPLYAMRVVGWWSARA